MLEPGAGVEYITQRRLARGPSRMKAPVAPRRRSGRSRDLPSPTVIGEGWGGRSGDAVAGPCDVEAVASRVPRDMKDTFV